VRVITSARLSEFYMEELLKAATPFKQAGYVGTLEEFKQAILLGRWRGVPGSKGVGAGDIHFITICNGLLLHLGYIPGEDALSPGSSYLGLKRTLENKAICWYEEFLKSREN
jgi:hypothetical protein